MVTSRATWLGFAALAAIVPATACKGSFEEKPPCEGVTCSGHGVCWASGNAARCECDEGYRATGLECVPVEADSDTDVDIDTDIDSDSDSDGDVDTDVDTDVDIDSDGDACVDCPDDRRCCDGLCQECCDDSHCSDPIASRCCDGECQECCDDSHCGDGHCCDGLCRECCDDSHCSGCYGTVFSCSVMGSEATCAAHAGCAWIENCDDNPGASPSCGRFEHYREGCEACRCIFVEATGECVASPETACGTVALDVCVDCGCTRATSCEGTAVPCERYLEDSCETQTGCSWRRCDWTTFTCE